MVLILVGCRPEAAPASPDNGEDVVRVVGAYCDGCHDSRVSADNAPALAVFDLQEPDWTVHMSEAQLEETVVRLAGTRGPTKDNPATDDEVELVRAYVATMLAKR